MPSVVSAINPWRPVAGTHLISADRSRGNVSAWTIGVGVHHRADGRINPLGRVTRVAALLVERRLQCPKENHFVADFRDFVGLSANHALVAMCETAG